jgi:predicted dehydrogenase
VDLHIHDTHFIRLLCGQPRRVCSTGVKQNGAVTYLTTEYQYGQSGPAISCSSGALSQKGREFVHGFEIYMEKATLSFESGAYPLTMYDMSGKTHEVKLKDGGDPVNAFVREIQAAVDAARTGQECELLSGKLARDALVLCQQECRSVRSGRPVAV